MPKFEVKAQVLRNLQKPLIVFAKDEAHAEEKAAEIILKWEGVEDCTILEANEVQA